MLTTSSNFVERCLAGEALVEDIYSFIDAWHQADTHLTLPEFLGFTADEYAIWLEKPTSLPFILFSKRSHVPLSETLKMAEGVAMAARARSQDSAEDVLNWLRRTGRI